MMGELEMDQPEFLRMDRLNLLYLLVFVALVVVNVTLV